MASQMQLHGGVGRLEPPGRLEEEETMGTAMDFAAVAAAITASIGFALLLEWVGLHAMMRLMPARPKGGAEDSMSGGRSGLASKANEEQT